MAESAFDAGHLIGHVKDAEHFEVPRFLDRVDAFGLVEIEHNAGRLVIPQVRHSAEPLWQVTTEPMNRFIDPLDARITKFMILEVVVAVIIAVLFIGLARKLSSAPRPTGRFWNMLEAFVIFLRDDVARPSIGKEHADKFLPFILTIFFFVLGCNLMGMIPWAGSPTGALAVTGVLALITFATVVFAGSVNLGLVGFWKAQVPHMDLPFVLAILLVPMIFAIEVMGMCIKHFVLAVRLLANMFAGHTVLAVVLTFIAAAWNAPLFLGLWAVTPASILGATALSLLELFVAFLQAYIFAFLAALFIGMAVHPH